MQQRFSEKKSLFVEFCCATNMYVALMKQLCFNPLQSC